MKNKIFQIAKENIMVLSLAAAIIVLFFAAGAFLSGKRDVFSKTAVQNQKGEFVDIEGLNRDCVKKILDKGEILPSCATPEAIKETYNADIWLALEQEKNKRVITARRIARGDIMSEKAYNDCLKSKKCAPVPLVPNGKKENDPATATNRKLFWHLVDRGSMTPEVCDMIDLCRALLKAGILKQEQLSDS